jgi:hypothetical protein
MWLVKSGLNNHLSTCVETGDHLEDRSVVGRIMLIYMFREVCYGGVSVPQGMGQGAGWENGYREGTSVPWPRNGDVEAKGQAVWGRICFRVERPGLLHLVLFKDNRT